MFGAAGLFVLGMPGCLSSRRSGQEHLRIAPVPAYGQCPPNLLWFRAGLQPQLRRGGRRNAFHPRAAAALRTQATRVSVQVCSYSRAGEGDETLSLRFTAPQRQGTLYAALNLLMSNFPVRGIECTYAISVDSLAALLGLSSREPEALTALRLQGCRVDFDEQLTECATLSSRVLQSVVMRWCPGW